MNSIPVGEVTTRRITIAKLKSSDIPGEKLRAKVFTKAARPRLA